MTDSTGITAHSATADTSRAALYRLIWRWHFYAGLLCLPVVLLLSVTGAIYLFKPQLEARAEAGVQSLTVTGSALSPNQLIARAQAAVPGSHFLSYRLPQTPQQAIQIKVSHAGEALPVYLNPYTGAVLAVPATGTNLVAIVHDLHGELLLGTPGSIVVELTACWAMVLLLSGLYLGWPRGGRGLAGVLYPRWRRRTLWRDLHAVSGFWIALLALFLLVTGLPWSTVWGGAFKELRQWQAASEPSQEHSQEHSHGHSPQLPALQPPALQLQPPALQPDWQQSRQQVVQSWDTQAVPVADLPPAVLARAQALQLAWPAELSVADTRQNQWKLSSVTQNRPQRADAWIDARGQVLRLQTFAQRPLPDRIIGIGVAAHEGQLFGGLNQLLGLLTALGLILRGGCGAVRWWRRRPLQGLGAPAAIPGVTPALPLTLLLILALLLPLLALSLLVIVLLEWLVLRRLAGVRQWLGLAV
jgi:uncharacterized iron-regulated membrane protein